MRQFDPHARPEQIALFVDTLFPTLSLADCRAMSFVGLVSEELKTRWLNMWREVRQLQAERTGKSGVRSYCLADIVMPAADLPGLVESD